MEKSDTDRLCIIQDGPLQIGCSSLFSSCPLFLLALSNLPPDVHFNNLKLRTPDLALFLKMHPPTSNLEPLKVG